MAELQSLVTALPTFEIYKHMKFRDPRLKDFGDMLRTSLIFHIFAETKGNNSKTTNGKVTALGHCTSPYWGL